MAFRIQKKKMNLIIPASIVEPPTESLMLRYLTSVSKKKYNYNNLLLAEDYMRDIYYHYYKQHGLFDYIDDIISEKDKQSGHILKINYIDWQNIETIISSISVH